MVSYLFIFFSSFVYLKTISQLVYDRESRNLEHMETMGMKKYDYLKAYYAWILIK